MNAVKKQIKNNKLLFLVLVTYIVLLVLMPEKAILSFKNSLYYVKEMLTIMPVILLLTSLITAWVPRRTIEKNFGKDAGIKGSIFSFLLGSFSAGPVYAAFPVCKMLLKKGASVSNVVVILGTWAVIKVPMLINEAKFLGPKFMAIRWVLTTIAIFIMGYITSKLVSKDEIPIDDVEDLNEAGILHINQEYCIGCGICSKAAPNHFRQVEKKAELISPDIKEDDKAAVDQAIKKCPTKAIVYTQKSQMQD